MIIDDFPDFPDIDASKIDPETMKLISKFLELVTKSMLVQKQAQETVMHLLNKSANAITKINNRLETLEFKVVDLKVAMSPLERKT